MAKKAPEEIALDRIVQAFETGSKELSLRDLHLTQIPAEIGKLQGLVSLDVSYNSLRTLPAELANLHSLKELRAHNNPFGLIPDCIFTLKKLERLKLKGCSLSYINPNIKSLKKLIFLDISDNWLVVFPKEIQQLSSLVILDLRGNSIEIPSEILLQLNSPEAILKTYSSGHQKNLLEAKLLFLGQGSVGKTSLVQRIVLNVFDANLSKTEGIAIETWQITDQKNPENIPKIKLNVWDFGGQETMHATHQFFLTKRSLYLLVLDSRLTQEENRVEYWLKIIQSFGGESPVLIVGNKIDQHPLDIDRTGLQKKYPNIVGILETSAATGAGIEELKAAITEQVNKLPHVRDLLPETWFTVKTKLEGLGRESNFITHDKYLELCAENEVSDETSQRTLIGFLHDLGVVLHFQDDPRLEALGILNPQWVTNGVYKILNSYALFQNKGVLTVAMLDEILNLPEYPRGKRLFIVDMMKKFELCYDIEPDKTFLVPDLLPKDQPDLNFNGVPAFEYAYPVLPSSVITRFIVRMNQKIDDGFVWRTGVVLKIGDNKALVKADIEDRKITIAIDGVEHTRRDALLAVCTHLDEIHDSIKGLNPEKLIPVPGAVNAKPLSYNYLLMLEAKGIEIFPVPDGNRLIDVNIRKVLSGVPNEIRPKESGGNVTNYYIARDGGIVVGGNATGNNLVTGNYNKINSAEIDPALKETLLQLAEAVNAMIQKLPAEQAAEVAEDFVKLADEAVKPKPNKKWYSVSIEGLIKAAENLDKLGTPVISLSRKVLSLLTGGGIK
ncbi:MAG: COR domain-containing protein [Chloroflexota bacterium]